MERSSEHPIAELAGFNQDVQLVRSSVFSQVDAPWPRCQDLAPASFAKPTKNDFVMSISHAWYYQTHPDPHGWKKGHVSSLIDEALSVHKPRGETLLFLDFMSTPQRHFAFGQEPRSQKLEAVFTRALKLFPKIYLMSDATIHIEGQEVEEDKPDEYYSSAWELDRVEVNNIGPTVQVTGWPQESTPSKIVPFDQILAVGLWEITSVADLKSARDVVAAEQRLEPRQWGFFPCCACRDEANLVRLQRRPFGRQNVISPSVRGWVYLERFVSMVKTAMVPESQMHSVAFSDSPAVLDQIFKGGQTLREAAALGTSWLRDTLQGFSVELSTKRFSAVSADKVQNVGGVGGVTSADAAQPAASQDRDIVYALMQELVEYLAEHWETERKAQQQRQLVLAVSRNDINGTISMLEARADPNAQDNLGRTTMHVAAGFQHHEAAKKLLEYNGDIGIQDSMGNCPAHMVALLSDAGMVPTFSLLAPSKEELMMKNMAGITPLERFEVWVQTELSGAKAFPPAQDLLNRIHDEFPDAASSTGASLAKHTRLGQVSVRIHPCQVADRSVPVRVWEPPNLESVLDILWLELPFFVPLRLSEPAVHTIARAVCPFLNVRIFMLSYEAVSSSALAADSFSEVHKDLMAVIETLPLGKPYVLVDNSLGETTPMLWKLRESLSAALVLNIRGYHSDDFASSDLFAKVTKRFAMIAGMCAQRDLEGMAGLVGDYVYQESPDAVKVAAEVFKGALSKEPAAFFEHAAFHCRRIERDIMERTLIYQSSPPLEDLPVYVACGAFSPGMWTLEAAPRLIGLIPESRLEYIPQDKSCWEIEGIEQTLHVANLLKSLLREANGSRIPRAEKRRGTVKLAETDQEKNMQRREAASKYFGDEGAARLPTIRAAEVRLLLAQALLVDCRSAEERRVSTIPGAVARSAFEEDAEALGRGKVIVAFCACGDRCSQLVQDVLSRAESERTWLDVRLWKAGLLDWCHEGGLLVDHAGAATTEILVWNAVVRDLFPTGYTVTTAVPIDLASRRE